MALHGSELQQHHGVLRTAVSHQFQSLESLGLNIPHSVLPFGFSLNSLMDLHKASSMTSEHSFNQSITDLLTSERLRPLRIIAPPGDNHTQSYDPSEKALPLLIPHEPNNNFPIPGGSSYNSPSAQVSSSTESDSSTTSRHVIIRNDNGKRRKELVKDEAYWERRKKNNDAAKRSRDQRRQKEDEIAHRAVCLEQENLRLKVEVEQLRAETEQLKGILSNGARQSKSVQLIQAPVPIRPTPLLSSLSSTHSLAHHSIISSVIQRGPSVVSSTVPETRCTVLVANPTSL